MGNYSIKQISDLTGVAASKIRYYEKEGLLSPIHRDANSVRVFSERDLELINLVKCLRGIGMSMKEVKGSVRHFLEDGVALTGRDVLLAHRDHLKRQIDILQMYIDHIDDKVDSSGQGDSNANDISK